MICRKKRMQHRWVHRGIGDSRGALGQGRGPFSQNEGYVLKGLGASYARRIFRGSRHKKRVLAPPSLNLKLKVLPEEPAQQVDIVGLIGT